MQLATPLHNFSLKHRDWESPAAAPAIVEAPEDLAAPSRPFSYGALVSYVRCGVGSLWWLALPQYDVGVAVLRLPHPTPLIARVQDAATSYTNAVVVCCGRRGEGAGIAAAGVAQLALLVATPEYLFIQAMSSTTIF